MYTDGNLHPAVSIRYSNHGAPVNAYSKHLRQVTAQAREDSFRQLRRVAEKAINASMGRAGPGCAS